jgi:cysteine-rich repeat protein
MNPMARMGLRGVLWTALLFGASSCGGGVDDDSAADDDTTATDDDATEGDDDATEGDDDDAQGAVCGNGIVEPGEVCDDGNTAPDDGCSPQCDVKRVVGSLGVEGTNYDVGRDVAGNVYLLFKDGNVLRFGRIQDGEVVDLETVPDSSGVHVRYTRPRLAVRPDGGSVHTAWISGTPGEEVYHLWRDEGGDWHREQAWSNDGAEAWAACPSIGVDLDGSLHLIAQKWWYDGENQDESSIVYVRKPGGGEWSAEQQLHFEAGKNWRDTSMSTDLQGGVHGAWKSLYRPGQYRFAASGDSLADHTTGELPIPGEENTLSFGDSFVTPVGDVHHVAHGYPGEGMWHFAKPLGAEVFGEPTRIAGVNNDETTGYENPWPAVAVDDHGRVYAAWAENRGEDSVPYVVLGQQDGGAWSVEDMTDAADMEANSKPAMTAVGLDVFLVWRGSDGDLILAELASAG